MLLALIACVIVVTLAVAVGEILRDRRHGDDDDPRRDASDDDRR